MLQNNAVEGHTDCRFGAPVSPRFHRGAWLWLFGVLGLILAVPGVRAESLLANGDFAQGGEGWTAAFSGNLEEMIVQDPGSGSGKTHVRLQAKGSAIGIDSPRFRLGRDLPRRGTFRVSALLRNRGIKHGDFGLRLYFYDASGGFVDMKGGMSIGSGTPAHDWRRREVVFGHDTPLPIPAAASTVMLRFSLWGPGNMATGEVLLDAVSLECTGSGPDLPGREERLALVWNEPAFAESAAGLAALTDVLRRAGFTVDEVDADSLTSGAGLSSSTCDVLVLPYTGVYPAPLCGVLERFLQEGGAVFSLGGNPLSVPLWRTGSGWVPLGACDSSAVPLRLPLSLPWLLRNHGPGETVQMIPDAGYGYARLLVRDLQTYAYLGTPVPALPDDRTVLAFAVRGDGRSDRLCVELRARDGSRWKHIIALDRSWREYRLNLADFVAYASEGRGGAGDSCGAGEVAEVQFGYTAGMVGRGRHHIDLRDLAFCRGLVSAASVASASWYDRGGLEADRWFGDLASCPRRRPSPLATAFRLPNAASGLLRPAGPVSAAAASWPGRVEVVPVEVAAALFPAGSSRESLRENLHAAAAAHRLTLLQALGGDLPDEPVPVATLSLQREGRYTGSWMAVFGLAVSELVERESLREAVAAACRLMERGIWLGGPRPRFRVVEDKVHLDVVIPAQNTTGTAVTVPLQVSVRGPGGQLLAEQLSELRVPAWQTGRVDHGVLTDLPLPAGVCPELTVHCSMPESLSAEDRPFMPEQTFVLNAREALRLLCDFMVAEARDDAKLHGYSFIDNRGMRTLLGGYEVFGDRRYRAAALAWGELMLQLQRPDGGYRMGYGIGSRGEECYVADGGEIAVGIARLVSYSSGALRQRLLASLDAYMAYRESFRVAGGGIGVGWCLTDYGQRPTVRLDTVTRIYAPEKNTYTIGCSLAAAYCHARLRDSEVLEGRAAQDADWLMARSRSLSGAFIESYVYAHHFCRDPQRRQVYADFIGRRFTAPVTLPSAGSWWLVSAGRAALNLSGLAYVWDRLDGGPEVEAEIMEALCAMFSPQSEESMLHLTDGRRLGQPEWIYMCYGAMGLADVIQPLVTMDEFLTTPPRGPLGDDKP